MLGMGQNFYICLRPGPRGLTPSPSLTPASLTVKCLLFFSQATKRTQNLRVGTKIDFKDLAITISLV